MVKFLFFHLPLVCWFPPHAYPISSFFDRPATQFNLPSFFYEEIVVNNGGGQRYSSRHNISLSSGTMMKTLRCPIVTKSVTHNITSFEPRSFELKSNEMPAWWEWSWDHAGDWSPDERLSLVSDVSTTCEGSRFSIFIYWRTTSAHLTETSVTTTVVVASWLS